MGPDLIWIVLSAAIAVILVLTIWTVRLSVKLNRIKLDFAKMLGSSGMPDLQRTLINVHEQLAELQDQGHVQIERLNDLLQKFKLMKARVGMYRYNAFGEGSSDLSFSIAVVDEFKSGFVLSGIHNREQTYIYAKPLDKGQSQYLLTPEEKEAIHRTE